MPFIVFTDAYVVINASNISDHVKGVTLTYSADLLDSTVMTTSGTKSNTPGLKDWQLDVDLLNDYAAASIDSILFALIGNAGFSVEVRPTSGARSTSNPGYTANGVLGNYDPMQAKVGDLATTKITIKPAAATNTLVRNIA
jgi:hypothetical protein